MQCPRCQSSVLREVDRDGITIDRCESCRGIWLDRGELEKLTARGRASDDDARSRHSNDSDDDDDDRRGGQRGERRAWWDIFD